VVGRGDGRRRESEDGSRRDPLLALLVGDERYRQKVRDIEAMLDRCTGLRVVTDPI